MSDSYPEYLNPFAEDVKPKTKLRIRNSFKELRRNLRQSFRIKKKEEAEDVTIRQKRDTFRPTPMSYPSPQYEALPRSRFRERLSRTIPAPNPFEEDDYNQDTKSLTARRKGKKRAPLPPKSLSSQNISESNLEVRTDGSHWSLTSVETDYSYSTDNTSRLEHEKDQTEIGRQSMVEKFVDFNKGMEQLKDDTNNNVITKEEIVKETESNNNIPDLVISCPSDTDSAKLQKNKDNEPTKPSNDSENEENNSDISEDDDKELVVTDITKNMIEANDDAKIDKKDVEVLRHDEEPFEYHEKTSLYVAGSTDELNDDDVYTGRVSLYITGSRDDLDASNNNEVCNKSVTDENSNDDAVPVPKQRKNKLSKNILLGM